MRLSLLLVTFILNLSLKAQKPYGLEYQRSFESILLDDYENFLFSSSSLLLTRDVGSHHYAYGLEIQEALKGEFGGLYVFGLSTDYHHKLNELPVSININTFLGGGGGAGAPDGSGLAYRYAIGLKTHLSPHFNLFARYSTYDLPTGDIGGKQVQIGFSYGMPSVFNADLKDSKVLEQSFAIQALSMSIDPKDASRLTSYYKAKLISVEYGYHINPKLKGLIRLQAAISNQIDGYMGYYSGLSYSLLTVKDFSFNLSALIGSSGGGSMRTSGGLGSIFEYGLAYTYGNKKLSISKGINSSLEADFSAYYTQIGILYNFQSTAILGSKGKAIVSKEDYKMTKIGVDTWFELHLAPDAMDYGSLLYEDMTLMCFGIRSPINSSFEILGQTRWALGGDYGAYAEGILGLSTVLLKHNKLNIKLPIQMIVAGGGGIDVGKGIGYQVNIEGVYLLTKTLNLSCSMGKMYMIKGNYNPLSFSLGLQKSLFFFIKK